MPNLSIEAERLEGQKMFQILAATKELERKGKKIIHFEIGDPDFNTPKNIIDATCESLKKGNTHYVSAAGVLELKIAAAEVTLRSRGFKPNLDQLLVTPGANSQLYYAIICCTNPCDEVIIPDPSFVSYNSIVNFTGRRAIKVPLLEENEFKMMPKDVQKAVSDKTKMIIINSPNNPTGSVMGESEFKTIYDIAKEKDVWLLSDEIYARMIYDCKTEFSSPSKYDFCKERTLVINGFSKSYAMTGFRLGVITGPPIVIKKMTLAVETINSCVAPFIQMAGVEALRSKQEPINKMIEEYKGRRDIMVNGLNTLPNVTCSTPKGAFYAFPNIKRTGYSSEEFSKIILKEANVAICPGNYFGENGEGFVRLCYANSIENIEMGIKRMRSVFK